MKKQQTKEKVCTVFFETMAIRHILIKSGIINEENYETLVAEMKKVSEKLVEKDASLNKTLLKERTDYIG